MTWPTRFLAVPPNLLTVQPIQSSTKATDAELRAYARAAPEVYTRLQHGFTPEDFAAMRAQPLTPGERVIGEAHLHLFSLAAGAQRLEAELVNGQLVVLKGQHRVVAAHGEGVPFVPVHVRAPDECQLSLVQDRVERDVSAMDPEIVQLHRRLDTELGYAQQPARAVVGERAGQQKSPERLRQGPL